MPEQTITRTEIVIPVNAGQPDQYGNLVFKDKAGKDFKVGKKRAQLFPLIRPDNAIEIGWAEYMNKPYIATIREVSQGLPPPTPAPSYTPKLVESSIPKADATSASTPTRETTREINGAAVGMTTNIIWEMMKAKMLQSTFGEPTAEALRERFKKEICRNYGVNPVIEVAKKIAEEAQTGEA